MAKNYNPPPKINEHAGVQLLNDKQRKVEAKMIRIDAMRFTIESLAKDSVSDMNNIINEAKKVADYLEYGTVPVKKK
jgi:hypothetical protein|tara:strand:+ start:9533 stop:9763 length:231 start_codon:yes stop_codon:yes gene_type:complete